MREPARELIESLCSGFEEFVPPDPMRHHYGCGPLNWSGYAEQRERAEQATGCHESVVCGRGNIGGVPAVLVCFEFGFLGGSIGQAAGAHVMSAFGHARRLRLPIVSLVASGGSRLQEGICALRQLQEIAHSCERTRQAGLPHVTVLRHPTTGGMWASLAAGADVILALPETEVAFAGNRVRGDAAIGEPFTSEGKLATGQVDGIVDRAALAAELATFLRLLVPGRSGRADPVDLPDAAPEDLPRTGWEAVTRARSASRARARVYLEHYFPTRVELGGTDRGMICGLGEHNGSTVAFAAQCGTPNTPAGFRSAARLVRLADRLGFPVLTLVDTPGAANDAAAETEGVGPAIAELFTAMARARVPVSTLVVGEGGSGGALALTSRDRVWITSEAYFAVIAPESAAAILKRPPNRVSDTADELWLRPQDLLRLGFVRGVVAPLPGAHPPTDSGG